MYDIGRSESNKSDKIQNKHVLKIDQKFRTSFM